VIQLFKATKPPRRGFSRLCRDRNDAFSDVSRKYLLHVVIGFQKLRAGNLHQMVFKR
jgi:hypothetical protein